MNTSERAFDMSLTIDSDAESVWRALTEAQELTRWFPPKAEVMPGPGGNIRLSWGEDVTGDCRIELWEPGKRLKMSWFEGVDSAVDRRVLAVDFLIEARGGQTVLRLVHSGFGSDESWDGEYDSISRGWSFELRSLRHYLERFRGKDRQVAFARLPVQRDLREAWNRLIGERGVFRGRISDALQEGAELLLELPCGEPATANLIWQLANRDFAATLDMLGDGVLRLGLETFTGQPELWLWLASWQLSQDRLTDLLESWKGPIRRAIS